MTKGKYWEQASQKNHAVSFYEPCIELLQMQAIEGELKSSLDQFQGYERQDLKYQEDVKHLKQKLKKLEEKIAKVITLPTSTLVCVVKNFAIPDSFSYLTSISVSTCVVLSHWDQDTAKIQEVEKETEEATVVIPKMEAEIVKLTQKLGEEEKVLEEIQENCKGAD